MTKTVAIRKYCLECGGNSKDVAFCSAPNCPLWEHRLGTDLRSTKGIEIMANNCRKYPKDVAELEGYRVDPALYMPRTPRRIGPKLLNKGLLAFKSRQKELALVEVLGGNPTADLSKKTPQKQGEGMIDDDTEYI